MYIHSRVASIAFKLVIALLGAAALLTELGIFDNTVHVSFLYYFTNISNIAVVLYLFCAAIALIRNKELWPYPWHPQLKHALMLAITVTCLVAHFMLNGGMVFSDGQFRWTMLVVHYIVPIGMILDWLLFDHKGTMQAWEPPTWTFFPLAYFAYVSILILCFGVNTQAGTGTHANMGGRWPYPFMDFDTLGVPRVLITLLIMIVFFIALGYLYVAIDHLLNRRGADTLEQSAEQSAKKDVEQREYQTGSQR